MGYENETKNLIAKLSGVWVESEKKEILKELEEVYRKAKAFDTLLQYKEHVEKYDNSDCHEFQNVFEFVMKEYEEDE